MTNNYVANYIGELLSRTPTMINCNEEVRLLWHTRCALFARSWNLRENQSDNFRFIYSCKSWTA